MTLEEGLIVVSETTDAIREIIAEERLAKLDELAKAIKVHEREMNDIHEATGFNSLPEEDERTLVEYIYSAMWNCATPAAWARNVGGTEDEPLVEFVWAVDQPEGKGWMPLFVKAKPNSP